MADQKFSLSILFRVLDKASSPMRKLGRNWTQLGDRAKVAGQKMRDVGGTLTRSLTLPVAGFTALTIKAAKSFEESMNMVGAVTEASGKDFQQLEDLARRMGATTQFSATQAADGMRFLGMAGLDVKQIVGALPKTLQLAASAQLDMGTAADIVTNVMSGFRMEVGDLSRVNDVLVNAFTSANMDLRQLGAGMQKAGPVAKSLGFGFEETAAALGILANNAFKGEEGGTGLRRIMSSLADQTPKAEKAFSALGIQVKNTDGTLKSIPEVLAEFEEAQGRLTERMGEAAAETKLSNAALKAFGQRGGPQFLALLGSGSEALEDMVEKLAEQGTATRVAEAQMKGLPGAVKLLVSAWEALRLSFDKSPLGQFIEDWIRGLASLMQSLSKAPSWLRTLVGGIALITAAVGPLLIGLGLLTTAIGGLTVVSAPWLAMAFAVIAALAGIAAGIHTVLTNWDELKEAFSSGDVWEAWKMGIDALIQKWKNAKGVLSGIAAVGKAIGNTIKGIFGFGDEGGAGASTEGGAASSGARKAERSAKGVAPLGEGARKAERSAKGVAPLGEGARKAVQSASAHASADMTVRIKADPGTSAQVEGFKQHGPAWVRAEHEGYTGRTVPATGAVQ